MLPLFPPIPTISLRCLLSPLTSNPPLPSPTLPSKIIPPFLPLPSSPLRLLPTPPWTLPWSSSTPLSLSTNKNPSGYIVLVLVSSSPLLPRVAIPSQPLPQPKPSHPPRIHPRASPTTLTCSPSKRNPQLLRLPLGRFTLNRAGCNANRALSSD